MTRSGARPSDASSGESSISTDSTDYMYLFQRNKGTKWYLISGEFRIQIFFLQLTHYGKIAEEKQACVAFYRTWGYHTLQLFLC